ncbi:Protein of unknown function [Pyronema omphalodes CBS 100304]|uniref:Uncharacterized protein n=1 Tax=Pyronema omphalodes (strain CBS 100304) TaxID=1076935 RepID=U4KZ47_PYROM|nr:Protein of unknown function [Pyronema omphalodes CBS 100304]
MPRFDGYGTADDQMGLSERALTMELAASAKNSVHVHTSGMFLMDL